MFSRRFQLCVFSLSLLTLSLSTGCFKKNTSPASQDPPISPMVGTWISAIEGNGIASTLSFGKEGSFVIDTDGAEGAEVTGRYTTTETQLTLTTESAPTEACAAAATYAFTLADGIATFSPSETDDCDVRATVLGLSFIKKQ